MRGWSDDRPERYPQELRERAVRMVFGQQDEHPSQGRRFWWTAAKFGISHETLRNWVAAPKPTRASAVS